MSEVSACDGRQHILLKHPVLPVILIGILIRLILAPFLTYDFDVYHWGVVIENFQAGNGLYEVAGYYYTPVWGYILGLASVIQDLFLNLDVFGARFTEMLPIEDLIVVYHTATTTTISFNLAMKIPLILCDALVGLIIYWLVKDRTDSQRKGAIGAALWMLLPTAIYMSGIQVQFDTMSVLFMLLTIILAYRDRYVLSGMIFAIAILLKFFPAACVLVFIAYILLKHKEDGQAFHKLLEAVGGAGLMAFILFLPQIIDGTFVDTLSFITGRVSGGNSVAQISGTLSTIVTILGMVYFGYRMYRSDGKDLDDDLFRNCMYAMVCATIMSFTPQYILVAMPLIIVHLMCDDGRFRLGWILIGVGSLIAALSINNFSLLDSSAMFLGLVPPEWVISAMQWMESILNIGGYTLVTFLNGLGNMIQFLGSVVVLVLCFEDPISKRFPKAGKALSNMRRWDFD